MSFSLWKRVWRPGFARTVDTRTSQTPNWLWGVGPPEKGKGWEGRGDGMTWMRVWGWDGDIVRGMMPLLHSTHTYQNVLIWRTTINCQNNAIADYQCVCYAQSAVSRSVHQQRERCRRTSTRAVSVTRRPTGSQAITRCPRTLSVAVKLHMMFARSRATCAMRLIIKHTGTRSAKHWHTFVCMSCRNRYKTIWFGVAFNCDSSCVAVEQVFVALDTVIFLLFIM